MRHEESHPSDQDLVMSADGELSAGREAAVRGHLASCSSCAERMSRLEAATQNFVAQQHSEFDSKLPPLGGARAVLRARLTLLAVESERNFGSHAAAMFRMGRSYRLACAALLGVIAMVLAIRLGLLVNSGHLLPRRAEVAVVPKPQLTPGATVPVTKQQVCGSVAYTQGPIVPASLQQEVFRSYGITNPLPGAYEIDYLITPDLGGAANIRNLWPQPYSNTVWTAQVKDQLEKLLHSMVCNGEIDVATAQHDLAVDWISAYKKYFHTDQPRSHDRRARNRTRQGNLPGSPAKGRLQLAVYAVPARAQSKTWLAWRVRLSPGLKT